MEKSSVRHARNWRCSSWLEGHKRRQEAPFTILAFLGRAEPVNTGIPSRTTTALHHPIIDKALAAVAPNAEQS